MLERGAAANDGGFSEEDERRPVEIRVGGQLDPDWADWLGDVEVRWTADGHSLLQGHLDQAALFGVLDSLRDRGVPLLSVRVGW